MPAVGAVVVAAVARAVELWVQTREVPLSSEHHR